MYSARRLAELPVSHSRPKPPSLTSGYTARRAYRAPDASREANGRAAREVPGGQLRLEALQGPMDGPLFQSDAGIEHRRGKTVGSGDASSPALRCLLAPAYLPISPGAGLAGAAGRSGRRPSPGWGVF